MPQRTELLEQLVEMMEQSQEAANEANQQRLRRLVGTFDPDSQTYSGGLMGAFGQSASEQAERSATRQKGRTTQSAVSRGIGNTTVLDTMQRGVEEDKLRALRDIEERVARQRAGVVEGVQDVGPNMGQASQLIQQIASVPDTPRQVTVGPTTSPGTNALGERSIFNKAKYGTGRKRSGRSSKANKAQITYPNR